MSDQIISNVTTEALTFEKFCLVLGNINKVIRIAPKEQLEAFRKARKDLCAKFKATFTDEPFDIEANKDLPNSFEKFCLVLGSLCVKIAFLPKTKQDEIDSLRDERNIAVSQMKSKI